MNNKILKLGNDFYNLEKLLFSEVSFNEKKLTLIFEGNIKKEVTHTIDEGFMLLVYTPFCHAVEDGDYKWKPSKKVMEDYIKDHNL